MPSGPGVIEEDRIAEIARYIPPGVDSFLLTSKQTADEIISQHKKCKTTSIQLCDDITENDLNRLRDELYSVRLIQVIHVTGIESIEKSRHVEKFVDTILLDSGNQGKEIKELGGTGRTHNWDISRQIVDAVSVPVFLAGGLNSENVAEAIEKVNPYAVDICSGVRSNGNLDNIKLQNFVWEVRSFNTNQQFD